MPAGPSSQAASDDTSFMGVDIPISSIILPPSVMDLLKDMNTNNALSDEQCKAESQVHLKRDQALKDTLKMIWDNMTEACDAAAAEHGKSFEEIHQKVLLTGNILKQRHRPALHNTFSYCWAQVDNGTWEDDLMKEHIPAIIAEAHQIGYRELLEDKHQALVDCLQEHRDARDTGIVRQLQVQMHDACITVDQLNMEAVNLHMRGGVQYIILACRMQVHQMSAPAVFFSNSGLKFMSQILGIQPGQLASCFDMFCVNSAGLQGVIRYTMATRHLDKKNAMKNMIMQLLHDQLFKLTGLKNLRLEWSCWDDKMTRVHGIVMVGWPLDKFMGPSKIKNGAGYKLLLNAVTTGDCHLRMLSEIELANWLQDPTPTPTGVLPLKPSASITPVEDEALEPEEETGRRLHEPSTKDVTSWEPGTEIIPFQRGGTLLTFSGEAQAKAGSQKKLTTDESVCPPAKWLNVLDVVPTSAPSPTSSPSQSPVPSIIPTTSALTVPAVGVVPTPGASTMLIMSAAMTPAAGVTPPATMPPTMPAASATSTAAMSAATMLGAGVMSAASTSAATTPGAGVMPVMSAAMTPAAGAIPLAMMPPTMPAAGATSTAAISTATMPAAGTLASALLPPVPPAPDTLTTGIMGMEQDELTKLLNGLSLVEGTEDFDTMFTQFGFPFLDPSQKEASFSFSGFSNETEQ
ncbi:hypothetical protein EWM64_g23 [Hericium alpestre]|uniref:Uncharacterized protein n=1 Tax=Hericium alpestre TaxID=135208 RepID=A0A4Z0ABK5_9AGAM|nr:hypothetical protein EWM64_g23 [Hericium alpestre]